TSRETSGAAAEPVRPAARGAGGTENSAVAPAQSASAASASGMRHAEAMRASYAECHRITRAAHSSFYLAFFGLPKQKRRALCALYAFMRLVDDVSDEPGDIESKRRGLARWRALLDEAVSGQARGHAILPALA